MLAASILTGCDPAALSGPGGPLNSTDGKSKVVMPKGWSKQTDLHDDSELQAANRRRELYLIVLTESKVDFPAGTTFKDHAKLTLDSLKSNLTGANVVNGPTEITINGRSALQSEIHGTIDGLNVVYIHTTVDGKENFYQLLSWTLKSKLSANKPEMDSIINSFAETN
jgi:hypothetical protein